MADVDFNNLFGGGFTAADALAATESKKTSGYSDPTLYKPSIKDEKCKDMNYRSLVRFIPFYNNGKWCTTLTRWECFLKDVNGENGIFVVSPKTDNKRCPIRNMSYTLYTSDNSIDKMNSKKINVYQQFYALVEVVKDIQHPEYDGKVFIYQFGKKIQDKIEAAMKSTEFTDGFNPFDLFNARLFEINLTKGDQKMDNGAVVANYDACRFIERTAPIHFGDNQTLSADDSSTHKAFFDWVENDAPKIKNYLWKEWDSETTEKVNALLATYKSGYSAPRSAKASAKETIEAANTTATKTSKPEPAVDDVFDNISAADDTPVTSDDDDWVNSILNS